jgi:hypothetical protein
MSLPTDIQLHLAPYIFCALLICTRILHRMLDNILCILFQECNLWLFVLSLYSFASLLYNVHLLDVFSRVFSGVAFRFLFHCNVWMCVCGWLGRWKEEGSCCQGRELFNLRSHTYPNCRLADSLLNLIRHGSTHASLDQSTLSRVRILDVRFWSLESRIQSLESIANWLVNQLLRAASGDSIWWRWKKEVLTPFLV